MDAPASAPAPFRAPPLPSGESDCNPPGISFWALVAEDYRTHGRDFGSRGFWALFWHRFGNWRMGVRPRLLRLPLSVIYKIMFKATEMFCGIKLDYTVQVGRRVRIDHFGGIIIGARSIGNDVHIRQNTTFGVARLDDLNAKPMVGDRVNIGAGAVLVGHISIGDDAAIGANAVVMKNVPPGHLAVGVPAVIRPRRGFAAANAEQDCSGSPETTA
jgi:serine O-acetyltransferase